MLTNTRGRTVFAAQPKRLPKDVDRLNFYDGTIVRKRSVKQYPGDETTATPPPLQLSEIAAEGTPVQTPTSATASARMRKSPSMPLASKARGPPPPLPTFPASWKPDAALPLRPVGAGSGYPTGESPALRPKPKALRERAPTALTPAPIVVAAGPSGYPHSPKGQAGQVLFVSALSGAALESRAPEGAPRRSPSMPNLQRASDACERRRTASKMAPPPVDTVMFDVDCAAREGGEGRGDSHASTTCSSPEKPLSPQAVAGTCLFAAAMQANGEEGGRLRVEQPPCVAAT